MRNLVPGQRWISNAEPELGLGTILRIEGRGVQVLFSTAGVLRQYALHSAPLTRAEFRPGQRIAGNKQRLRHRARQRSGRALYLSRRRSRAERIRARRRAADLARGRAPEIRAHRSAGSLRLPCRRAAAPCRCDALARVGSRQRAHRSDRASAARRRHRLAAPAAARAARRRSRPRQDDRGRHDPRAPDRDRPRRGACSCSRRRA